MTTKPAFSLHNVSRWFSRWFHIVNFKILEIICKSGSVLVILRWKCTYENCAFGLQNNSFFSIFMLVILFLVVGITIEWQAVDWVLRCFLSVYRHGSPIWEISSIITVLLHGSVGSLRSGQILGLSLDFKGTVLSVIGSGSLHWVRVDDLMLLLQIEVISLWNSLILLSSDHIIFLIVRPNTGWVWILE